jgi:hypothetical protein
VAIPVLDFKKFRDSQVRALRTGMGGGVVPGVFKGPDPEADGRALVEIGVEGNIVSVPHGGGVFPVGGEVLVQVNDDLVPTGLLAGGSAAGGETVALGATGEAIAAQGDKLGKSLDEMGAKVKAAAEGPVDTGRLRAGEVLIKGDLIAGNTIGAKHIAVTGELEAKLATIRQITTDEIVAGKAKISGSLIADTLEGKTLRGSRIEGGSMVLRPENTPKLELHIEADEHNDVPSIALKRAENVGGESQDSHAFLVEATNEGGFGTGYHTTLRVGSLDTRTPDGRPLPGGAEVSTLDFTTQGVTRRRGTKWIQAFWEDIVGAANAYADSKSKPVEEKRSFGDLDRDWRREPREFELVKTGQIVDLFGGEWVRQNSEWNYTGNTWYQWGIVPEGYRPKQWVHFTVVITEDNFPHFAQGQIRPDGTFALKVDKGIRVKPNVSRIMIPPVRWHL